MNELPVEVLFQFSFRIFMTLSSIFNFLRDGVPQGHHSAKEVVFQKLMFCKRSVHKIRSNVSGMKVLPQGSPGVHHENVFTYIAGTSNGSEDNYSQLIRNWCSDSTITFYNRKILCWNIPQYFFLLEGSPELVVSIFFGKRKQNAYEDVKIEDEK